MSKRITIELLARAPESAIHDDTAGYAAQQPRDESGDKDTSRAPLDGLRHRYQDPAYRLLAALHALPDPRPQRGSIVQRSGDVQGFMRMEEEPKGDGPGGGGPGSPFGLLTVIAVPIGRGGNSLAGLLGL